jgi:hypothetical protein
MFFSLADAAPARGASTGDVIFATAIGAVSIVLVVTAAIAYRKGRLNALRRLSHAAERASGLPGWASVPILVAGPSLLIAVFGFHWDVSWHIDRGRDPGPFANPAHWFIFIGLWGIALAGILGVLLGSERPPASAIRFGRSFSLPIACFLLALCGVIALGGFPLDDIWHRLFGQDVTLWGPTHIQMVGGASLATLAIWALIVEGRRATIAEGKGGRLTSLVRFRELIAGGTLLIGLSTMQAEFDYGVPQFRLVYQPILIMLAASIGLVAVRLRGGRGSAIGAALVFLAIRGGLTLLIGPVLGRSIMHFPLYLAEALLVELVALRVSSERPLAFALWSGGLIGTVGLTAEWGWTQIFMPLPWNASLLPQAAILGLIAALGGGVIGVLIGGALAEGKIRQARVPWPAAAAGAAALVFCIGFPLPIPHNQYSATVQLRDAQPAPHRMVVPTVTLHPTDAAEDAKWFNITAWQGAGSGEGGLVIADMTEVRPGIYRTDEPVPVYGNWKTLLRLHTGDALDVVPIYLPEDPAIPAPLVPARDQFTRPFQGDKEVLQREAIGGSPLMQAGAYAMVALIGAAWVAAFAWGFSRLRKDPTERGTVTPARAAA